MNNRVLKWLVVLLIFSNLVFFWEVVQLRGENSRAKQVLDRSDSEFVFISPHVAWLSAEDFVKRQHEYRVSYTDLRQKLEPILNEGVNGNYGLYFEDLATGAWIGVREKEQFLPQSLLKVPIMIALLKKVGEGNISLEENIVLTFDDIDERSGILTIDNVGRSYTVKELITIMITYSDNTALRILYKRFITDEDVTESLRASGLTIHNENIAVTPKQYSNMFRSLYYSSYLPRPLSELALAILSDTKFSSQLPAGIPKDVKISHKVGFDRSSGYFHDCGIVYVPDKPYFLCVMSTKSTQEEADRVISSVSKMVYEYITERSAINDLRAYQ